MAQRTWAHRATHPLVTRLIGTPVRPNHLTALRLLTGLAAVACFAAGATIAGGALFLASAILDRADGELARLGGMTSRTGHLFDLASDVLVTALLFLGIGLGLREMPLIGPWAALLGAVAGLSVALIFLLVTAIENRGQTAIPGGAGIDPDDTLFLIAPLAWLGWLPQLLVAAAVGAPTVLALLVIRYRRLALTGTTDHSSRQLNP